MTYIYFDLETIPTQSAAVRLDIGESITPPGSMKKPETIAAWEANEKPQAIKDAIAKTSFDPAFGHICTIGYAIGDVRPFAEHTSTVEGERGVIEAFFNALPSDTYAAPTFVGHYISGFDLRFILCRAVILGIPIPKVIPRDIKPWGNGIFDTMTAWAGNRDTISLDKLCKALGIPGKDGFDGSMVAEAWANGEHDKIAAYCIDDVSKVREIHRRFVAANW
jgi:DNA polymerase elongation subunit (family B)